MNAAILFGRQRTSVHHQTKSLAVAYSFNTYGGVKNTVYQYAASPKRSREAIVPNLSGFAGVSFRYPNAKVSFGYRADMFFGAVDGGIDARKTYNRGFYGPFATISIGLGR